MAVAAANRATAAKAPIIRRFMRSLRAVHQNASGVEETLQAPAQLVTPLSKPLRLRDRHHLKFVGTQPCLACGRSPADAHHLKFAQQRGMGLKVSDEFTVPLCRLHHRELHRYGDERIWWQQLS